MAIRNGITVFVLCAASMAAATPTQEQLDRALDDAEHSWGFRSSADGGIVLKRLNNCAQGLTVAWTDLVARQIQINSACQWDRRYLAEIVQHEVGHLLSGQGHSLSRHSVMFAAPLRVAGWQVLDRPRITAEDRRRAREVQSAERPTIIRGE